MPYEFQGDNLVYVAPKEVAGYTWQPMAQNENGTNPEGQWVKNEDFNPDSLLKGRTDKYGRVDYSLKDDATEAEKRAYQLAWQGAGVNSPTLENNSVGNDWQVKSNLGWWDVDPAIQRAWEENNRRNSGNAVGMSGWKDWIVPASILAAGAGTAIGTGALAGETAGGAAGFAGPTYAELGYSPHLLTDASLGYTGAAEELGLAGSTSGLTDLSGAQGSALLESMGLNTSGMSVTDVLKTANNIRKGLSTANNLAKLLTGGASAVSKGSTSFGGTGSQLASALTAPQQEITGLYRMNQTPFLTQQKTASISPDSYNVSGQEITSPIAPTNEMLAKLLYPKA